MASTKQDPSVLCHQVHKRNSFEISVMDCSPPLRWYKTCITISIQNITSNGLQQCWFLYIFQFFLFPSFLQGSAFWLESPFTQLGSQKISLWSRQKRWQMLTTATASYWPGSVFASVLSLASSTLFLGKNKVDENPGERVGCWEWGTIALPRELLDK